MKISEKQFIDAISRMKEQYDIDLRQAQKLSDIYGSDINPNNNSRLYDTIIRLIRPDFKKYKGYICEIEQFCWEHNFGRHKHSDFKNPSDLYRHIFDRNGKAFNNKSINEIEVKDPKVAWQEQIISAFSEEECEHPNIFVGGDGHCHVCGKKVGKKND